MNGINLFNWAIEHPLEAVIVAIILVIALAILSPANLTGVFAYRNKLKLLELQMLYGTEEAKNRARATISKTKVSLD